MMRFLLTISFAVGLWTSQLSTTTQAAENPPPEISSHNGYLLVTTGNKVRAFVDNREPALPDASHDELLALRNLVSIRVVDLDQKLARTIAQCASLRSLEISNKVKPGAVAALSHSRSLDNVSLPYEGDKPFPRSDLAHLTQLKSLRELWIPRPLENGAEAELAKLTHLTDLHCELSDSPDSMLWAISQLKNLTSLSLECEDPKVGPTGETLKQLAQNLTSLMSVHIQCSGSEPGNITSLFLGLVRGGNIERITLRNCNVSPAMTAKLPQLKKLHELSLLEPRWSHHPTVKLTYRQLKDILKCKNLRSLGISLAGLRPSQPLEFDSLTLLTDLHIHSPSLESIQALRKLSHLTDLTIDLEDYYRFEGSQLNWGELTPEMCAAISQSKNLKHLSINAITIPERALANFEKLHRLKHLRIDCRHTDSTLARECPGLLSRVEYLATNPNILGRLRPGKHDLKSLHTLHLSGAFYTRHVEAHPARRSNLELKGLSSCAPKLEWLFMSDCDISIKSLLSLSALPALQRLTLHSSKLRGQAKAFPTFPKLKILVCDSLQSKNAEQFSNRLAAAAPGLRVKQFRALKRNEVVSQFTMQDEALGEFAFRRFISKNPELGIKWNK